MVGYADRLADGWRDGEARDLHADMARLTLEVIVKTLFDAEAGGRAGEVGEAMATLAEGFPARFRSVLRLPPLLPTPGNVRHWRSLRRLDRILFTFIRERRAAGGGDDMLGRMP